MDNNWRDNANENLAVRLVLSRNIIVIFVGLQICPTCVIISNMEIIGHQEIRDFFAKVITSGNLSHAYCFVGRDRVGKRAVAESIASELLGIENGKLLQQPDFFVVEQMFDEKKEKTKA